MSLPLLQELKNRYRKPYNIRLNTTQLGLVLLNEEEMGIRRKSFDTVLIFAGLHHLVNLEKVIDESSCWLRPGGIIVAFEPNRDCWYRKPMPY